jgi:hypothetical protein
VHLGLSREIEQHRIHVKIRPIIPKGGSEHPASFIILALFRAVVFLALPVGTDLIRGQG